MREIDFKIRDFQTDVSAKEFLSSLFHFLSNESTLPTIPQWHLEGAVPLQK